MATVNTDNQLKIGRARPVNTADPYDTGPPATNLARDIFLPIGFTLVAAQAADSSYVWISRLLSRSAVAGRVVPALLNPFIKTNLLMFGFSYFAVEPIVQFCGGEKNITPLTTDNKKSFARYVEEHPISALLGITLEEVIFRGIMVTIPALLEMERGWGHLGLIATLVSSTLFSLGHWNNSGFGTYYASSTAAHGLLYGNLYRSTLSKRFRANTLRIKSGFAPQDNGIPKGLALTLACHLLWNAHCYIKQKIYYS
ncbi:MAG: CPBP family intramembrane metalloprotease [Deltaproteobacteria bacterium]|nr:CPBP family intramembrane metalloprotease [Deltaproteobacteria bacterium]